MDIVRLPPAPIARPAAASNKTANPTAVPRDPAEQPAAASFRRQRVAEPHERVVQGELLERERAGYQSTRAFLDERNLEHARPAEQTEPLTLQQSRSAISHYLDHARPETVSELAHGRSVNFFI